MKTVCSKVLIFVFLMVMATSVISTRADVATCSQTHTVVRGDTISKISRQYGTSIANIQALNAVLNINLIYVGQKLCVNGGFVPNQPPQTPVPSGSGNGKVTAYYLNVRSGPGVNYGVLRLVRRNDLLEISGKTADGKWLQVSKSPTNSAEWVSSAYVTVSNYNQLPVIDANTSYQGIQATVINQSAIYFGPGTNYGASGGTIYVNQNITIVGKNASTTWFQIQTDQGRGWVPVTTFPDSVKLFTFNVTG